MRTIDAADVNVLRANVGTCLRARADYVRDERRKDSVGPAADVLERNVGNVEACLLKCVSSECMIAIHRVYLQDA